MLFLSINIFTVGTAEPLLDVYAFGTKGVIFFKSCSMVHFTTFSLVFVSSIFAAS